MTSANPSAGNGESGFTLIELLVALTLLGFLTLLLFTGLHFGRQAWEGTQSATRNLGEIRAVEIALRRELTEAYPMLDKSDPVHPHIAFVGSATHLQFLTPAFGGPPGELIWVTVDLDQAQSGAAIAISETPELAAATTHTRVINLPTMNSLHFSYFGPDQDTKSPVWQTVWRGKMRFPTLIRLSDGGTLNALPEFVVKPRVAADITCSYDSLSGFCRGR